MTVTLVTFVCVDTEPALDASLYPAIGKTVSSETRRRIYWENALVNCATARRCVPDARVCVFTNDNDDVVLYDTTLHRALNALQVERIVLPFTRFVPPSGAAVKFRNAFYRLNVLRALAHSLRADDAAILYDSDCVWTRAAADLEQQIPQAGLWLSTPRKLFPPHLRYPVQQSRADFGALYRALDKAYPEPYPIYYGAEFIGARGAALQALLAQLEIAWARVAEMSAHAPVRLHNGESIYDNDEYLLNFVCNNKVMPVTLATGFMRRIQTLEGLRDVRTSDLALRMWHLVSEKRFGLLLLTPQVLQNDSAFWKTPLAEFANYLGAYVGIPKRKYHAPRTPRQEMEFAARMIARRVRAYFVWQKAMWQYGIEKQSRADV